MSDKLESARRAGMFEGKFAVGDLVFRPFTVATPEHLKSLGIADKLESKDDQDMLDAMLGIAWTLHAPLDEVNGLCFEIEEAATEEDKGRYRKAFRRKLLEFKSRLEFKQLEEIVQKVNGIFERHIALQFDTVPRSSAAGEASEVPPGNS